MKKRRFYLLLPLIAPFLLVSCASNPTDKPSDDDNKQDVIDDDNNNQTDNNDDKEEGIDSLAEFLKELSEEETYYIQSDISFTSYNQGEVKYQNNLSFTDSIYLKEKVFLNETFKGGFVNQENKVGAYKIEDEEVSPLAIKSSEYSSYQDVIVTLHDLNTSHYQQLKEDTYTLNISLNDENIAINQTDYMNYVLIMNVLDLVQFTQYENEVKLTYLEEEEALYINVDGSIRINVNNPFPFVSTLAVEAKVSLKDENVQKYEEDIKALTFEDNSFKNSEVKEMIEKINSGYTIENFKASATDGSTLDGTIYSTKDYIVYDYSNKMMELISGYAAKNGALYQVIPTENGTNLQLYLDKASVDELNLEMGTSYSAIQLGKILFESSFGLLLPDGTLSLNHSYLYDSNASFMAGSCYQDDVLNLFNIGSEVDNNFSMSIFQGILPGGYLLTYGDESKSTINFGYYGYGKSSQGSVALAYNKEIASLGGFGSKNAALEILLSRI